MLLFDNTGDQSNIAVILLGELGIRRSHFLDFVDPVRVPVLLVFDVGQCFSDLSQGNFGVLVGDLGIKICLFVDLSDVLNNTQLLLINPG